MVSAQKMLHRARSLRRLHNDTKTATPDEHGVPPMPPTPSIYTSATPVVHMVRPRTHYGSTSSESSMASLASAGSSDSAVSAASADSFLAHDPFHRRQPSTASRESSSWSSMASSTKSLYQYEDHFDSCPRRAQRQTVHDLRSIRLASSDTDDESVAVGGLSPPPPRHHALRPQHSDSSLSSVDALVVPRARQASSDEERYMKRGDWKRRGIVFSGFDSL